MNNKTTEQILDAMRERCIGKAQEHLIRITDCVARKHGFTDEQRTAFYNAVKDLPSSLPGKRKGTMLPVPVYDIGMTAVKAMR